MRDNRSHKKNRSRLDLRHWGYRPHKWCHSIPDQSRTPGSSLGYILILSMWCHSKSQVSAVYSLVDTLAVQYSCKQGLNTSIQSRWPP